MEEKESVSKGQREKKGKREGGRHLVDWEIKGGGEDRSDVHPPPLPELGLWSSSAD